MSLARDTCTCRPLVLNMEQLGVLLTSLLPTPFNFLTFTLGTGLLLEHVHCLGELCQVRMRIVAHTREYGEAVEQPTYGGRSEAGCSTYLMVVLPAQPTGYAAN